LNRAAEQLLGKSRADLLGKVLWEVCPELGGTLFEGGYRRAMAERVPVAFEDYYGPRQRWYATSSMPYPEGGITLRAVDITERKRAEHEMAASREEFDRFFALIPDLAVVASADGFFKKVNPAWEKTLGFSSAEVLGQPIESFIHPDDVAATCQEVLRQLDGQGTIRFVNRYRTKAGEYRWLEWVATPAVGGSLYATARDITARKQAEAALPESEAKFRDLFDGAPVAYHELDMDGMVRRVNRAECALLGYEAGDMLGRPIWEFISGTDREASRVTFRRKLSGERPLRPYQRCYLRRDGGDLWVEIHDVLVRDEKGEIVGIRTALVDITERKRAEEYRKMNEEVLRILNGPGDLQDAIQRVLAALNTLTRCDAIGMRLQDGEDFPYFAQEGFSEDFLLTENTLIERAADGGVCRNNDGSMRLECTCGLVISGKTDPANPLFTKGGSCWTNDSLPLLDLPPAQDPRLNPRNECIHHGYASVALVPIRSQDGIVGLIHLNHRRKGRFTLDTIELLEGIAAHIGEALMRKRAEEESRAKEHVLSESQRVAHVGSWSWDLATDAMVWTSELYRVFGVSLDTFVPSGEALLSVIHPDDRAAMQAWIVAVWQGKSRPRWSFA